MSRIESLAGLRPGDIMFGPIGGAAGVGVGLGQLVLGEGFSVGPLSVRHVGIVVEASSSLGPAVRDDRTGHYTELGPNIDPHQFTPAGATVYPTGVITTPRLVQAMPGGAEEIEMTADTHWTDRHAYARLPEDYPGQAADAAAIARLMVAAGVAYSWASYAALAAWKFGLSTPRLESWIGRRQDPRSITMPASHTPFISEGFRLPVEAICSVLADQSWSLAGKKVMTGVPHQCVTPGALARQLLFRTEGVEWAFPGQAGR